MKINLDYENITILLIVIITILYLIIKFKKNKENFEDITYDILTSSSSNPLEIKNIEILNNLECDNLNLNEKCETNINKMKFNKSNISKVKINNLEKDIDNLNNNGKIILNEKVNQNITNAKFNNLNTGIYTINNAIGNDTYIIRINEDEYNTDEKDNIKKLYTPNTIKYNNATLYLTKIEYLDGLKRKVLNGLKWKK